MKIRNLLIISLAVISLSGFLTVFSFAAEPETNNAETEIVTRAEITECIIKLLTVRCTSGSGQLHPEMAYRMDAGVKKPKPFNC
jgi:hypothetical protein